jgi:hypothetical protein
VIEPQYVCGADTFCLCQPREITPEHVTKASLRRHQTSGKFSLTGIVCLLTTGGLIRVRPDIARFADDLNPRSPSSTLQIMSLARCRLSSLRRVLFGIYGRPPVQKPYIQDQRTRNDLTQYPYGSNYLFQGFEVHSNIGLDYQRDNRDVALEFSLEGQHELHHLGHIQIKHAESIDNCHTTAYASVEMLYQRTT